MEDKKFIVIISGPTATGKTDFSIMLAHRLNVGIISADSMQVYKGLDIGTDKVSSDIREKIPHYLIDIRDPCDDFSVADFLEEADAAIKEVWDSGRIPLVVGGTGFYIDSLIYGLPGIPGKTRFRKFLNDLSQDEIIEMAMRIDPEHALKIGTGDRKRLIRMIEVYLTTGKPLSAFKRSGRRRYDFIGYFLYRDRQELYSRIEDRVDSQMNRGLLNEVKMLYSKCGDGVTAMQAIGYKELLEYIKGNITLDAAVRMIKVRTRRFAKRQFTWFRKRKGFKWINLSLTGMDEALNIVESDIKDILLG